MPYVFISYSGKDFEVAVTLEDLLSTMGFQAWIDRKRLIPGVAFAEEITRELRNSFAVVTLWSANSLESVWVRHETSYAITAGKHVALRLDGFDPNTLPGPLRRFHCPELAKIQTDPAPLIKRLKELAAQNVRPARMRRVVGIAASTAAMIAVVSSTPGVHTPERSRWPGYELLHASEPLTVNRNLSRSVRQGLVTLFV